MKSLIIAVLALLCVIFCPTTTMGGWPKPSEVSNKETLMNAGQHQPHLYAGKFNFGDSKIWKCTYVNGSGVAISISYPSPPQPPSQKPSTPSSPPTPKIAQPPPKPSPPPPTPKKSPLPPKPSPPPIPKMSPPLPTPSPPRQTPKNSHQPPKSSPPPTPKMSPTPSTPSAPRPAPKKSPPPPIPSCPPTLKMSPPPLTPSPPRPAQKKSPPPPEPKTSVLIIHSPPPPKESITPSNPWHHQNRNAMAHFIYCRVELGPSAICKQQIQLSYYTRRFRVSDECCNLFVNMRNECSDVILGFYDDPYFLPLLRCTCHVKIY